MGCGATAAIAAAGIGTAVGSVAAGAIGASAAGSAANKQAEAASAAAAQQQAAGQQALSIDQNGSTQALNYLSPYTDEGQTALTALNQNLSYLDTPYQPTQAQLAATPGYQFALQQGLQSTQNAAAAQGLGVSGAALKAAASFATGTAQNTYTQDAGIYQQNQSQIGNLLTGMASNGQNAATSQAQIQQGYNSMEGNALIGQANESAQTSLTGAQAQASGTVGAANSISSGITGATSGLSQSAILSALLAQNTGQFGDQTGQVFSTAQLVAHQGG